MIYREKNVLSIELEINNYIHRHTCTCTIFAQIILKLFLLFGIIVFFSFYFKSSMLNNEKVIDF